MKSRSGFPVAAALLAALLCTRAFAAPCPDSEWSLITIGGWRTTAAAVFDTSSAMTSWMGGERATINIPGGWLGVYRCCGLGITATRLVDAFDVTGVPPGTIVVAVADLVIDGWILGAGCGGSGCWGDLRGTIAHGPTTYQQLLTMPVPGVDSVHVSGTVTLPVTITAGTPERIDFMLEAYRAAGGSNGAHGIGTIRFRSLPPGVRVISCKGYDSATTPVRATSWGALKVVYR